MARSTSTKSNARPSFGTFTKGDHTVEARSKGRRYQLLFDGYTEQSGPNPAGTAEMEKALTGETPDGE